MIRIAVQICPNFVLLHKLRECLEAKQAQGSLGGKRTECETDTTYSGGYGKPANHRANRIGKRSASSCASANTCPR